MPIRPSAPACTSRSHGLLASTGDADAAVELLEPLLQRLRDQHPDDLATIAGYSVTLSMAQADSGRYTEAAQLLAGALRDGGDELDRQVAARVNYALSRLEQHHRPLRAGSRLCAACASAQ